MTCASLIFRWTKGGWPRIFSRGSGVVDNFLFRPPPFEHVERLMSIRDVNPAQGWTVEDNVAGSPGNFLDWRAQSRSFDHLIAWRNWFYSVAGPEGRNPIPEQIRGVRISPSFFTMLGVQAVLGRTFVPEEEQPGREQVVILTDGLWRRRYGGDPGIVGETLLIDGQPFTVIGVLPRGFYFLQPDFEMWMPFAVDEDFRGRDEHSISVWARLAPGVSLRTSRTCCSSARGYASGSSPCGRQSAHRAAGSSVN